MTSTSSSAYFPLWSSTKQYRIFWKRIENVPFSDTWNIVSHAGVPRSSSFSSYSAATTTTQNVHVCMYFPLCLLLSKLLKLVQVNATAFGNGIGGALLKNNGEHQKLFTILQLTSVVWSRQAHAHTHTTVIKWKWQSIFTSTLSFVETKQIK